ncbi:MAG: response regulator [Sandaracinaceae bacterium]|nr:response regulator [Sandaracinaceae bacterium]
MTVRIIVIDDSAIAIARIEEILEEAADLRVVRKLMSLEHVDLDRELGSADVVIVDMLMPGRSGLGALDDLVARKATVVVSDAAADSSIASEAAARGVAGFVTKRELADAAGRERLRRLVRRAAAGRRATGAASPVVALVGSTGAHRALELIVPSMKESTARGVVVQHMPEGGEESFVAWLTRLGVPARLASPGLLLQAGQLVVGGGGRHLEVERSGRVRLRAPAEGDLHVPSGDALLRSLVPLAPHVTAVILSGLGRDGSDALGELEAAGARVLVQAPEDCVARSMPEAALARTTRARAMTATQLARELSRADVR